jgi:hypothetical protein
MNAARAELYDVIEELSDDQVAVVLAEARRVAAPQPPRTVEPFAWVGMGASKSGRTNIAEHIDDYLAEGFGRD